MVSKALKNQKVAKRLTPAQAAKVRSLMEDEGESRASAVAWVRAFETTTVDAAREDRDFFEARGES